MSTNWPDWSLSQGYLLGSMHELARYANPAQVYAMGLGLTNPDETRAARRPSPRCSTSRSGLPPEAGTTREDDRRAGATGGAGREGTARPCRWSPSRWPGRDRPGDRHVVGDPAAGRLPCRARPGQWLVGSAGGHAVITEPGPDVAGQNVPRQLGPPDLLLLADVLPETLAVVPGAGAGVVSRRGRGPRSGSGSSWEPTG